MATRKSHTIQKEKAEKYPEYVIKVQGSDEYVPNRQTIGRAPLSVYFELLPNVEYLLTKFQARHGRVYMSPPGMDLYSLIDRDVGLFAVYAVDMRVGFHPGTDASEILFVPPNNWSETTRRNAGVLGIPGVKPSVFIPFVPFEM